MNTKYFAVIGIGSTGYYVAKRLEELGHRVLAMDKSKDRVEEISPFVREAIVGDCTRKNIIQDLPLEEIDTCIICIGEALESSILATLYLKELGIKHLVCKAFSEDHAAILEKMGIDSIFFPEKDMGIQLADQLDLTTLLNNTCIDGDLHVLKIVPNNEQSGKTLAEVNFESNYHAKVIALKNIITNEITMNPPVDHILSDMDILIIAGFANELEQLL